MVVAFANAARRSRALECGGLPPLSERSRQALSKSGGKPPHSKAALRAAMHSFVFRKKPQ
jgi:hypothetical protein